MLVRLHAPVARLAHVGDVIALERHPVVLSCPDANTVMVAAALGTQSRLPVGVWLDISDDYPASLAARDVATLSWLIEVRHVVVGAAHEVTAHAQVLHALLTNDEVNLANDVVTLRRAYNRPAPPRRVTVWIFDGNTLVNEETVLRAQSRRTSEAGELTLYR